MRYGAFSISDDGSSFYESHKNKNEIDEKRCAAAQQFKYAAQLFRARAAEKIFAYENLYFDITKRVTFTITQKSPLLLGLRYIPYFAGVYARITHKNGADIFAQILRNEFDFRSHRRRSAATRF